MDFAVDISGDDGKINIQSPGDFLGAVNGLHDGQREKEVGGFGVVAHMWRMIRMVGG